MSDLKSMVQNQFGKTAENYRTSKVHAAGPDLEAIVETLRSHAPIGSLLDAGCGAGHVTAAAAPHVTQVTALDLTEDMLRQVEILCNERGLTNVVTQRGDVENIPFPDETFDVVVSRYSAHHWLHPLDAVREIRRVLKPGGFFILADVVGFDEPVQDTYLQTIELLRDPSHVRDHTAAQWTQMFNDGGMAPEMMMTWTIDLGFESWTERMAVPPARRETIREVMQEAPAEVKEMIQLRENCDFTLHCVMLKGTRSAN